MIDLKGIEALHTALEQQSFEKAAHKLHLTQSAISQRIKGLELQYGEPVLIRISPYRATDLGKYLIGCYKQICILEDNLQQRIRTTKENPKISIALNRDSLETWFLKLIKQTKIIYSIQLDIITDDQELTLNYFKQGFVSACLSTSSKPVIGGKAIFLGNMEYIPVASTHFSKRHFAKGFNKTSLLTAPAIKFDKKDTLHKRYLEKYFDIPSENIYFHSVPSVQGFKELTLSGHGYALIPKIDILDEIKNKRLIQLSHHVWNTPLYWHYWKIESEFYQSFNKDLIHYAKSLLAKQL